MKPKNNLNTNKKTTTIRKKPKSRTISLDKICKKRYAKACFTLYKLRTNKRNGIFSESDQETRQKCMMIIRDYQEYKKMQNDHIKNSYISQSKPAKNRRSSNEIVADEFCLALVNEEAGKLKPVTADWEKIQKNLNDFIMKHLLWNTESPIPRFKFGEMYRGYILIQCQNVYSKEFICNSMSKIREEFESLNLTVVPVTQLAFTKCDEFTSTTPVCILEQLKSDEMAEAPPPPSWPCEYDESREKTYNSCQKYLKNVAQKETLTPKERKKLAKDKRIISNYQNKVDVQQPEGFQLTVNYFETDSNPLKKTVNSKEEILNKIEPSTWELPQAKGISELNLKKERPEDSQTCWKKSSYDYCRNVKREDIDNFSTMPPNEQQTNKLLQSSRANWFLNYYVKDQHEFPITESSNSSSMKPQNTEDFFSSSWRDSSSDYHNNSRLQERERNYCQTASLNKQQSDQELSQISWDKVSVSNYNPEFPQMCGNSFQAGCATSNLNISQSKVGIAGDDKLRKLKTDAERREASNKEINDMLIQKYERCMGLNNGLGSEQKHSTLQEYRQNKSLKEQEPKELSQTSWINVSSKCFDKDQLEESSRNSGENRSSIYINNRWEEAIPEISQTFMFSEKRTGFPQTSLENTLTNSSPKNAQPQLDLKIIKEPSNVKTAFSAKDKKLTIYKRCQRILRHLENCKELTPAQRKRQKKARQSIRKYEALQANNKNSNSEEILNFQTTSKNQLNEEHFNKNSGESTGDNLESKQITDICRTSLNHKMSNSFWNTEQTVPNDPTTNIKKNSEFGDLQSLDNTLTNSSPKNVQLQLDPEIFKEPKNIKTAFGVEDKKLAVGHLENCRELTPVQRRSKKKAKSSKRKYEALQANNKNSNSEETLKLPTTSRKDCQLGEECFNISYSSTNSNKRWSENSKATQGYELSQYIGVSQVNQEAPTTAKQWPALLETSVINNRNNIDTLEESEINNELCTQPNNSITTEECTKAVLEQRIFEFLNALSEDDNAKTTSPKRHELEIATTSRNVDPRNICVEHANKPRTSISRKRGCKYTVVETIVLTDDSETSDIEEVTTQEDIGSTKTQYFKALANAATTDTLENISNSASSYGSYSFQNMLLSSTRPNIAEKSSEDARCWNPSILGASKSDLQIAIIDRTQRDFKLHQTDWLKLEKNLLLYAIREIKKTNNASIGLFDAKYWYYGIKVVQCENVDSLQLIKHFIRRQDTRYDTLPFKDLPHRTSVKVWIPPPLKDDATIFKILKEQNYSLYTYDWTIINSRERDRGNGKDLYISVSQTSLERLRLKNGRIRFGNEHLKMIFPKEVKIVNGDKNSRS